MKILESFVASPFAGTIGWTLLHSLWEGGAISALLVTVMIATRSARIRYAAACVAMIGMVVAFVVTIYRLMPESAQNFPRFRTTAPLPLLSNVAPQTDAGRSWLSILSTLAPWLAPFWVGGVLLLSLQRVMSCVAVRRLRSRGVCFASEEWHAELARLAAQLRISRPVHLLESCFAEIPMVLGHLRPVILVPIGLLANLPSEQVETILLHELAHIRRCDYLVNALQRIIESVLFYHPAVWWISKVMRTERENCCDDVVVSVSQHANEYARALAALERNRLPRQQAAVAATGGTLVKRIRRLLYPKAPAGIWAPVAATTIFVVTAAVSLAAWQPKPAQSTPIKAQAQAPAATNVPVKTFYLVNSETPEHMDTIVTALRQVLDSQNVQAVYAKKAIVVRDTPEKLSVARNIIDVEENQTVSSGSAAESGQAARLRLQIKTLENDFEQNHLDEVQKLRNAIFEENSVAYIVTPEERAAFLQLQTNDEREAFITRSVTGNNNAQTASSSAPDALPQLKPLSRAPISLVATEDSRMIYQTIASLAGVNVEFDPSFISHRIDVNVSGVSVEKALDAVSRISRNKWTPIAPDKFVVAAARAQSGAATQTDQTQNAIVVRSSPDEIATASQTVIDISTPAQQWLNQDVVYIISDDERKAFLALNTDEERQQFVKEFWERRNPTPGSADNKFKDEHYRRIAYSNEHFATPSGKAGWQTDRGHIYIVYGPPDTRNHFLPGQNGSQFATEQWRYNHIEGVGDNLMFEFVDREGNGDFVLVPSPSSQVAPKSAASDAAMATQPNENLYRGNPVKNSYLRSLRQPPASRAQLHDSMLEPMLVRASSQSNQVAGASNASAENNEYAKKGLTILSPTEGVDFNSYIQDMLKSIQAHWYKLMPQEAMKGQASGQVSVIFSIQPDGKLLYWQMPESSGIQSFDEAARDAVRDSFPLQPLPKEFHGPYLKLKLTFAYNQPLHS